jgi:hypothetical protein
VKITRMRLFLPPRMKAEAQLNGRTIAEAAARAIAAQDGAKGPLTIRVDGHGRPARLVANDVAGTATRLVSKNSWRR